jgi:peptide/nickel transport system ATP-binding protein
MALLEVESLGLSIGRKPILRSLSFSLEAGRILGLAGMSGSGKSQTLLSIMRLVDGAAELSGSIRLDGVALEACSEAELCAIRGRDIGMVFQEPLTALDPIMTVGEQIIETVRLHTRSSRTEAREVARQALELVELPVSYLSSKRYPHELSGGQRQRLAIAMAIALRPKLLITDEPTASLDASTQMAILALLRRLVRNEGMGLLLVSHDLTALASIADDMAILHDGEIIEQGETLALLDRPHHPYAQSLVASVALPPFHRKVGPDKDGPPVLEAREISCTYPKPRSAFWKKRQSMHALDGVGLTLRSGEILGIVGESGSGKSTLVRRLLALVPPQGGEVRIGGEVFPSRDRARTRRLRGRIQVVFQDPYGSFDPRWRIEEVVAESLGLRGARVSRAERRRLVEAALVAVGLDAAHADRLPYQFSGGQRQRIAIARALILKPDVIALDEATSALDPSSKAQILALLTELVRQSGTSLLFVSHDMAAVRSVADRVMVMKDGRVVETGETADVFDHPHHPYTLALLASAPPLERVLSARRAGVRQDEICP